MNNVPPLLIKINKTSIDLIDSLVNSPYNNTYMHRGVLFCVFGL